MSQDLFKRKIIVTTNTIETERPAKRPIAYGLWLIFAAVVGWIAAFSLTMEKFHLLEDPNAKASCDFSVVVQCGLNLGSWQGSVFGFPNPILGLAAWMAPLIIGVAVLGLVQFPKWFWSLFTLGVTAGLAFVIWLISQSIFVLGTLCPWCMVTWSVMIPTFFATWVYAGSRGLLYLPKSSEKIFAKLRSWVPLIVIISYFTIAFIAQMRLDFISTL